MSGILVCLATNLVCCCSSAACHCCSQRFSTGSSVATRIAYAFLFLGTSMLAWSMQTGWVDHLLTKIPNLPYTTLYCPEANCFTGNFAVARILFALSLFHLVFALAMLGVKTSKDVRAGIQNGWWGPKFVLVIGLIVAAFFIPDTFFHTYSIIAFVGSTFFILIQLVLLIDFAANWSESWVRNWEDSGSKIWLGLLAGTGAFLLISIIVITGLLYAYFCKKGCGLNIFFVTFNLILGIIACALSIAPKVQEVRPSSGILQAAVIVLYATYLISSALSDETFSEDASVNCNPFSEGGQQFSTILGTLFTFVVLAYSTTRAATKSKVLMGQTEVPKTESAVDEAVMPLIVNEEPAPINITVHQTSATPSSQTAQPAEAATQPAAAPEAAKDGKEQEAVKTEPAKISALPSPPKDKEQELIEIGVIPNKNNRKRYLEEAVESGALPQRALDEDDEEEERDSKKKGYSKDDEKDGCNYNYSFYHAIFAVAAMYVTMLINEWSTINLNTGEMVNVGHDWSTVWVKVVSSWIAIGLYVWTLLAPVFFPDRDWS